MQKLGESNSSESKKPSHVRKLNFGQSILTLDVVKQFHEQKNGVLLTDRNVAIIPSTKKNEFVRNWIETHKNRVLDSDESSQTSPILGSSVTKRTVRSPIFGTRRKRTRGKYSSNGNTIDDSEHTCWNNTGSQINKEIFNVSAEYNKYKKVDCTNIEKKENVKRNLFNFETSTNSVKENDTNTSPVLDKSCYSYKRRRRKFGDESSPRKALDRIENKCAKTSTKTSTCTKIHDTNVSPVLDKNSYSRKNRRKKLKETNLPETVFNKAESSCIDANVNTETSRELVQSQYLDNKYKIMSSQKQFELIRKLENSFQNDKLESFESKSSRISEDSIVSDSLVSEGKLNIEDSPKDIKDVVKMEIESSNEDDNCTSFVNIHDIDENLSARIEDADTQDVVSIVEIHNHNLMYNLTHLPSKPASICSQTSTKDSDKTFFSKAEEFPPRAIHLSQKISQISSQISSQINDPMDNNSIESRIVISTQESPQRTDPDPSMHLNLLDFGKKKRKPKRGSLSEKLQSAINRQISFVRIWRHQIKQAMKNNTSLPCVAVHVKTCVTRFSRQFLEGITMEDPLNLLPWREENKFPRSIKIMIIPEIVGKIELKAPSIVEIFPPWEVLDDKELILHVTYINITTNSEKTNLEESKTRVECVKRPVIKQFDCPCITAGKMILSCRDRFGKPNVIEKLFID
ncbi:vacuolar protein sorting 28 isoform X1 [Ptiloglossa arizonensis]|uniref:vacuolar protein sorting 28 isoform X1 n=1 Tax=Ptiloglossa arizonensis TaxID=3350558 RepID=UPI003FA09202